MVGLGSTHRYYVYQGEVDMRKSFDGLHGLVVNELGRTGLEGDVYVFSTGDGRRLNSWYGIEVGL